MRALRILMFGLIICSFTASFINAAKAESTAVPTPKSRASIITDINNDIEKQKQTRKESQKQVEENEKNIQKLRLQLVGLGKNIRNSETNLDQISHALKDLQSKKDDLMTQINAEKNDLGKMVMALQRLKRTPPETVLINPGKPLEIAQTALLLEGSLQAIQTKTEHLRSLLEAHHKTHGELLDKKDRAASLQAELNDQFKSLSSLLEQREKSYTREKIILAEHTRQLNSMAAKAKDLKDLLANIRTQAPISPSKAAQDIMLSPDQLPKHGDYILPVSGFIKTTYGVKDRFGALSQGYLIESYTGALVMAPFGGQIKYAGPFKNHQNLVIIEHRSGYHSLIGGLAKVNVHVGQVVVSGEALGLLGSSSAALKKKESRGDMYFELRHNGKPVDPSTLFSDLG